MGEAYLLYRNGVVYNQIFSIPKSSIEIKISFNMLLNNETYFIFSVSDNSARILKFKNFNSESYTNLSTPIEAGEARTIQTNSIGLTSTYRVYTCGFENELGEIKTLNAYLDNRFIYYWFDDEGAVLCSVHNVPTSPTLTLPSTVNGKPVEQFGYGNSNMFLYNDKITTLTIPSSYKKIDSVFVGSYVLNTVRIENSDLEFVSHANGATAFTGIDHEITFYAPDDSTTKTYIESLNKSNYTFVPI